MARVAITESYLEDIADAIRAKNSSETLYKPSEMSAAILALPAGGGIIPTGTKSITTNGTHDVYNYAYADVSVSSTINNQDKTVNPSTSQQSITADSGYTGLGTVTVNAMPSGTAGTPTATKGTVSSNSVSVTPSVTNTTGYITGGTKTGTAVTVSASELVSGNKSITANGTNIDVTNYSTVSVNVSGGGTPTIDSLSVTPSTSEQVFNSSSVDGYKPVTVAAMPTMTLPSSTSSTETGTRKANIFPDTISTTYLNIPTGYNSTAQSYCIRALMLDSKTISANGTYNAADDDLDGFSSVTVSLPSMTLPTSASASATSGYTSKATIGRSTSDQYINIPTGYNSAGAYYKISAVANGSATGPSSITQSSATVSTGTNTLTLTKTNVSTTPTVSAGYVSSATASTATVALTASVTTKAAATITPGTTDQTISSGTYLTGTQTISGDADLIAGNIKKDVSIFGVTGTYDGGGGTSKNVQTAQSTTRRGNTSLGSINSLTCSTTGTYDVYWTCARSNTSQTWGSQLYIGGTAYGSENTTWSNNVQNNHLTGVSISANQTVAVYGRSRGSSYYIYAPQLTIVQTS